ncbi:MAG: lipid A biosynthesis lauroyl acyltransferase [Campylobacterota bacterium]|nr:lipid A biosynthesis lauroyl acyltransferase [Campylobacterota bacterium]
MILFYFYRFLELILMRLPHTWRRAFFIFLAKIAYTIDAKHRRVILQNLHFALGHDLGEKKEEEISRYCYENLLLSMLQVMENRYLSKEEIADLVTIHNQHITDKALRSGRPIIFVSAHYGNWELGAAAVSSLITPTTAIYKKFTNPYFDRYLIESRSIQNMLMVEKKGAVRHLTKAIKNRRAIMLMIDQNTSKRDGISIDFFGKSARQSAAPAFLARKYNGIIIPILMVTKDDKDFTVMISEPIEVAQSEDSQKDILEATQKQSNILEAMIRKNPKLWFWCHRRWKTEHPEIYKL